MVEVLAPVVAEPADIALDRVDIFPLLLGRIGVVEPQMAAAAELFGDAEIERDGLGVADVQVAVRLRREPGHDLGVPLRGEIGGDDVADEIASGFREGFARRHADPCCAAPWRRLSASFTVARRDGCFYRARASLPVLGAVVHRLSSSLPAAGPARPHE